MAAPTFASAAWRPHGASGPGRAVFGLGLAALGRPGYLNLGHGDDLAGARDVVSLEARAHEVLDAAWRAGVRYFDVARSYGRAESFLASWLAARRVAPDGATVGSKWGYTYTAGWQVDAESHEVKEHTLPVLQRQWGETRAILGDHLDLYQVHSATLESGVLDDRRLLAAMSGLKRQGVSVGLSTSGPAQAAVISRALDVVIDGVRLFDTVQATWNLLEPSAEAALTEARAAGLGVIVKEAVANGRLTDRNDDAEFADRRRLLEREAARLGTTIDALALRAALAQPWADVVLSGAATAAQLRSNVAALEVAWDDRAAARLAALREDAATYWRGRAAQPWT